MLRSALTSSGVVGMLCAFVSMSQLQVSEQTATEAELLEVLMSYLLIAGVGGDPSGLIRGSAENLDSRFEFPHTLLSDAVNRLDERILEDLEREASLLRNLFGVEPTMELSIGVEAHSLRLYLPKPLQSEKRTSRRIDVLPAGTASEAERAEGRASMGTFAVDMFETERDHQYAEILVDLLYAPPQSDPHSALNVYRSRRMLFVEKAQEWRLVRAQSVTN